MMGENIKKSMKYVYVTICVISIIFAVFAALWGIGPIAYLSTDKTTYKLGETVNIKASTFYFSIFPQYLRLDDWKIPPTITYQNGTVVHYPLPILVNENKAWLWHLNENCDNTWDQSWMTNYGNSYPNLTGTYTITFYNHSVNITITS
jgi:hypothetical protein